MRENCLKPEMIYLDNCLLIPMNEAPEGLLLVNTVLMHDQRGGHLQSRGKITVNTFPGLLAVFS